MTDEGELMANNRTQAHPENMFRLNTEIFATYAPSILNDDESEELYAKVDALFDKLEGILASGLEEIDPALRYSRR